jgi:peptide/nickel transport system substrate-binding protein
MSSKKKFTRRQFFIAGGGLAAGAIVAACSSPAAPQPAPAAEVKATEVPAAEAPAPAEAPAAAASKYKESPMLTELVNAGKLPPIDERLPKDPYVVKKGDLLSEKCFQQQIGKYGGVMRLGQESPGGDPHIFIGNNEPLLWAPNAFDFAQGIHGNVVKDWEANADGSEYTFHMREGLKWSDGVPVTTEDVQFTYEDVLMNEKITPVFPNWLRTGNTAAGSPGVVKIIDDYTFTVTFDGPYGAFPAETAIAGWRGYGGLIRPKHYLTQFHEKYADPAELKQKLVDASIPEDQWQNLFNAKQINEWMWNITNEAGIGSPLLTAWLPVKVEGGVFTFERNPYYFKVDEEGNQLPYMDGIRSEVVQDKETLTTRALMGEFDYLGERASLKKLPLMKEQEAAGKINVLIPKMHRLPINFNLNYTFNDPTWRAVTGDVRFRKALSYAINRPEILKTFYLNQFASLPERTNPIEYDVDKANALLDEMGMDKKGDDGFRLAPDGKPFSILFEVGDLSEDHVPMAELMAEYWKKVGINTTVKKEDWNLVSQRFTANELQATDIWAHETIWPSGGWDDYLPGNYWGQLWHQWYMSQGKQGEEPPDEVKKIFDSHKTFMTAPFGSDESKNALQAIYQSYLDNVWTFNVVQDSYYPTFTTKRIHNVPIGQCDDLGITIMYSMEQWFIDEQNPANPA